MDKNQLYGMRISQIERTDLIIQFIPPEDLTAIFTLFETDDTDRITEAAQKAAKTFGVSGWEALWKKTSSAERDSLEQKLIDSFHSNLILLVQKTWVEKADETFKEQVLYKINQFCSGTSHSGYRERFITFAETISDAVFLMFGNQAKQKDFTLYALRIDPLFGLFWWLVDSVQNALNQETIWTEEKYRVFLLLGMSFISNY